MKNLKTENYQNVTRDQFENIFNNSNYGLIILEPEEIHGLIVASFELTQKELLNLFDKFNIVSLPNEIVDQFDDFKESIIFIEGIQGMLISKYFSEMLLQMTIN